MQHSSIVDFCLDVHETHSWLQMCRKYYLKHVFTLPLFLKNYLRIDNRRQSVIHAILH